MTLTLAERGRLGGQVRSDKKKAAARARVARLGGVLSTDKKSILLKRRWLIGSIQLGYADALLDEWCAALKQQQVLEGEKHGT
jgi:hypothetical protein